MRMFDIFRRRSCSASKPKALPCDEQVEKGVVCDLEELSHAAGAELHARSRAAGSAQDLLTLLAQKTECPSIGSLGVEPWRGRARVLMGSVAHEEYTPAALTAVAHVLYADALRFDTADEAHRFFELLDAVLGQADGEEVS